MAKRGAGFVDAFEFAVAHDLGIGVVDLHGVTLGEELGDTARHLGEHTLDDVATVDTVVACHVVAEAAQGDGLLLLGLRIVLPVTGVV